MNLPRMEVVHMAGEKPDHLRVPLHYSFVRRRIFVEPLIGDIYISACVYELSSNRAVMVGNR